MQALIVAFIVLLLSPSILNAETTSAAVAAERLGLSANAIERVKKGEVVAESLEASSDKDLSLAIIMRVDASVTDVFEFVDKGRIAELQTVTISTGPIDPKAPSLAALELPKETVTRLAKDPSDTFFMSVEETERVVVGSEKGEAGALDAYRKVLEDRVTAYWNKGLAGIAPYAGKNRSPSDDLAHANEAILALVQNPVFRAEFEAVPSQSPGKAEHRFSWAVQKGRDQEAPVLIHRINYKQADGDLFFERRFYSGYDYDALQLVVGVLPTQSAGTAVFYLNHTYTSQVAGFGGGAKRAIGREILEKELVAELTRIQKALSAP